MISKITFYISHYTKQDKTSSYNLFPWSSLVQDSFLRGNTMATQTRKPNVFSLGNSTLFFRGQSKSSISVRANSSTTAASPVADVSTPEDLVEIANIPYLHSVMSRYAETKTKLTPIQTYHVLKDKKQIALGDLHASLHKLVEVGIVSGRIKMEPDILRQFIKIAKAAEFLYLRDYEDDRHYHFNVPKLLKAKKELDRLIPQMQWRDKRLSLMLVGDVLADRSCLPDEPTLDLIESLSRQSPKAFIRIASNHDHSVLQFFRDTDLSVDARQDDKETGVYPKQWDENVYIWSEQCRSLLHSLAIAKIQGTLPALRAKYFNYLKQSKLLYFDDKTNTLFFHAKIKQRDLRKLYQFLFPGEEGYPQYLEEELLPPITKEADKAINRAAILPLDPERLTVPMTHADKTRLKELKEELKAFVESANQAYQKYVADTEAGKVSPEEHKAWDQLLCGEDGFLWTRQSHRQSSHLPTYPLGKALVHGHDSSYYAPYEVPGKDVKAKKFPIFNLDQEIRQGGYVSSYEENPIYIVDAMAKD